MQTSTIAKTSVYLSDPFGVRLADASNFVKLQYTRVVNDVGTLKLWLPADFDTNLIRIPDGRIEVWRRDAGSSREYLDTEVTWLIKALQWDRDDNGDISLLVEAVTPLQILKDRIVDSYATYGGSEGNDTADNIMKTTLDYTIGSLSSSAFGRTDRNILAYLSIQAANGQAGAIIQKSFAWRTLLPMFQELATTNYNQNGIYLAFDIVAPTPNTLEFRTYIQQRGVDHRFPGGQNPVIFGGAFANVGQATHRLDYGKEITFVRAGGQGQNFGRVVGSWQDNTRIGVSPFGMRESFVQDTQETSVAALNYLAAGMVRAGRPRLTYRGRLLSVPGCQYGIHWGWGDFVTVQDFGRSVDCRIDAVTVTVEKAQEKIDVWARSDT